MTITSNVTELFESRDLLFTWTRREFKIRYSQSLLGVTWAIIQPCADDRLQRDFLDLHQSAHRWHSVSGFRLCRAFALDVL